MFFKNINLIKNHLNQKIINKNQINLVRENIKNIYLIQKKMKFSKRILQKSWFFIQVLHKKTQPVKINLDEKTYKVKQEKLKVLKPII